MKFSRHAKNNMKLYKISKTDIIETVESPDLTAKEGAKTIALKKFANKYSGYPLKVVYEKGKEITTIISAYPLKRKHLR